jgi:hypothetical protein
MCNNVVEFARDPEALVGDRAPCPLLAFTLELHRPLAKLA